MNELEPVTQQKLYGLDKYLLELIRLYQVNTYPNKILLSGPKGVGKSTLAYHFINYVLSKNEQYQYDITNFKINSDSQVYKTTLNKSNPNLNIIDVNAEKKFIDINQIRELIKNLNKSSLNDKPRFVLIDNIEFLNINSINALLKILEEPNQNINFILVNNNKKVLPTLLSRCINYKINLSNTECMKITELLLGQKVENLINKDLINYYSTPGYIYNLIKFSKQYEYNLVDLDLKNFLKKLVKDKHLKKDQYMKNMIYNLIEFYFRKLNLSFSKKVNEKYGYFLKRVFDTRTFNLDEETLFAELEEYILNG